MPHLSLAQARLGAENILHRRCEPRFKVQMGRHFILCGYAVLAVGASWEQALENLTYKEVVQFCEKNALVIPQDALFSDVAALYLNSPQALKEKYPPAVQPQDAFVTTLI